MTEDNALMRELMQKVADQLTSDLRESLAAAVEREISKTLSGALLEGEFYRRVNDDLQKAFKEIYQEIKVAKAAGQNAPQLAEDPNELFSRASNQPADPRIGHGQDHRHHREPADHVRHPFRHRQIL